MTIQIHNRDAAQAATPVFVFDTLPEGWAYEWGSAAASTGTVEVTGANPYRFKIASLAAGAEVRVTYRSLSVAPPNMP